MAPSTQVLTTKLNRPSLRASLVPRPRLTERLHAGLSGALTVVAAPAGSGKTTLVTEWLAAVAGPVAWLSLDEDDNDPVRFLSGLAAALARAGVAASTAIGLLQGPRPELISPRTVLTALLNELAAPPGASERLVVVLDDYHLLSSTAVHEAVGYLLEKRPAALHVVITSRTEPPIHLARLRANGQLTEIRADDLSFTVDEASAFLRDSMGVDLTAEQVAALAQRTEGWVAALQLAALALRGKSLARGRAGRAAFVAGFTGSHRYVLDYLLEEVLSRQTKAVRDFLEQTALLERLCGPLCEAVTGQPGGAAQLAALERAHLFLVPLDDERRWYRYHHLFAEALRSQLTRHASERLPELHLRASQWFEQAGLAGEAIHHALAAGSDERAADLLDPAADRLIRRGELATIGHWLAALPEALILARPGLCLWQAWTLIPRGRLAEAEDYARTAEAGLRQQRAAADDASPECQRLLAGLLGQALLARCSVAQNRGDLAAAAELVQAALAVLPAQSVSLRSLAQLDLGHIFLRRGDLTGAWQVLHAALAEIQGDDHPFIHTQILCQLAEVGLLQLRLHAAEAFCRQAVSLAEGLGLAVLSAEAWLYLGEIAREWNQLDEAAAYLARCVALAEQGGDDRIRQRAYNVWARVQQARGDWDAAADCLARAEPNPAAQAWLWLAQGNLAAAQQIFRGRGRRSARAELVWARLRLAQGQAAAALPALSRWRAPAEAAGRQALAAQVALLQALAYQHLGQWPQALRSLDRALALAEPGGCVRLFLDEGAPMAVLLARHAATRPPRPYVQRLLANFPAPAPVPLSGAPAANSHAAAPLLEPLRAREADIVRLLAAGLSNPEIAERLSLSVNTVRWYIKQVYRKLDVHTRTQAALRARELNL